MTINNAVLSAIFSDFQDVLEHSGETVKNIIVSRPTLDAMKDSPYFIRHDNVDYFCGFPVCLMPKLPIDECYAHHHIGYVTEGHGIFLSATIPVDLGEDEEYVH